MSMRRVIPWLGLTALLALLAGCALDPIEEQQDKLESMQVAERQAAVEFLKGYEDERTVELLVETLEGDPDLLEQAGNALVLKGREWEAEHPNAKKSEQNPVIEQLSQTVGDMHLEAAVRTKACWVLGEIGSRRAIGALNGRVGDPNSTKVRDEATKSLSKLGFKGDAVSREMLGDGKFVESYDDDARETRGLMSQEEKEARAAAKESGEAEAETKAAKA